jgi:hypothetical protein
MYTCPDTFFTVTVPPPQSVKLESKGPTNVWLSACVVSLVAKSVAFSFTFSPTRFWYVMPGLSSGKR